MLLKTKNFLSGKMEYKTAVKKHIWQESQWINAFQNKAKKYIYLRFPTLENQGTLQRRKRNHLYIVRVKQNKIKNIIHVSIYRSEPLKESSK